MSHKAGQEKNTCVVAFVKSRESLHVQECPQCPVTGIPLSLIHTVNVQSPLICVDIQGGHHMGGPLLNAVMQKKKSEDNKGRHANLEFPDVGLNFRLASY